MSDRDYSFSILEAINASKKENIGNQKVLTFLNQLALEIQ